MSTRRSEGNLASQQDLRNGWECCNTPAGLYADPSLLPATLIWTTTTVPSTAASALRAAGTWSLDGAERRFDAEDWWFRTTFEVPDDTDPSHCRLGFDGLATLCDVWLNGTRILRSENMFLARTIDAPPFKPGSNVLVLQFHALDRALKQKRPRPRWRAPMVENQQLRWHRTTLLGRTPGWSPPAAAVGPWKPVWVDYGSTPSIDIERLRCEMRGSDGRLELRIKGLPDASTANLAVHLRDGEQVVVSAVLQPMAGGGYEAVLALRDPRRWWPHTHGHPHRYEVLLSALPDSGAEVEYSLGHVGFRSVEIERDTPDGFRLRVNGTRIFCRGACWTPLDIVSLQADEDRYRHALQQVIDAGFNMLRLSGAMAYEDELFFRLCNEFGVLVWQDFMFANMDYPADDAAFAASVGAEATQHLRRWARHPCVAVVCGNSEVSQQSAMWGASRELWEPLLFGSTLAALTAEHCPGVPYWPSSALGGAFPHQTNVGTTSYYGAGAYLRGTDDLRRSDLRFATECLAFANIPEGETLNRLPGGLGVRVQHAAWKARSPRDLGAGWDFDDVRDHYVREFYGVDPTTLRYSDHGRYLTLGREASAEAMSAAFAEWRRARSSCGGALIWFLRDLWPGAGWGIIDSEGIPKAPYHALRRVLQPVWISISDEGLNGIAVHVGNETPDPLAGTLELLLYRDGRHLITRRSRSLVLPPRTTQEIDAASLLDEFHDLTFAYRFGPLSCDLVVARWREDAPRNTRCQAFFLPQRSRHSAPDAGVELTARARAIKPGIYAVAVHSKSFVRGVQLQAEGYRSEDAYFWLAPDDTHEFILCATDTPRALFGAVSALNGAAPVRIEVIA